MRQLRRLFEWTQAQARAGLTKVHIAIQSRKSQFKEFELERLELLERAQKAEDANKAKSEFLAHISHEIRSPMGVILGIAELALDAKELTPETRNYITMVKRNAQQVACILGEVLDLSRIEASRLEIDEVRFPLLPLVEDVVSSLNLAAKEKGIKLDYSVAGRIPKLVKTDPTRLRQILVNLLANAIKFTPSGSVLLTTRMISPALIGSPLELQFTVEDTGIGIHPEVHAELFKPFSQLKNSIGSRYGGTGLGLMLSKQLCRALRGDLRLVKSVQGWGSVFEFEVNGGCFEGAMTAPELAAFKADYRTLRRESENFDFHGKRVLVVEDSPDNQELLQHYLSSVGLKLDLAQDGAEALMMTKLHDYDLVLMDIQMPRMDGHMAVRALRKSGFARPILALTAHALKEDRDHAFESGFDDYLTKPILRDSLLRAIAKGL